MKAFHLITRWVCFAACVSASLNGFAAEFEHNVILKLMNTTRYNLATGNYAKVFGNNRFNQFVIEAGAKAEFNTSPSANAVYFQGNSAEFSVYHKGTTIIIEDNQNTQFQAPAFPRKKDQGVLLCFKDAAYFYYINNNAVEINAVKLTTTPQPLPTSNSNCDALRDVDYSNTSTGDVNNPDAYLYILDTHTFYLPINSATKIYGNNLANKLFIAPKAKAALNTFSGSNTLQLIGKKDTFSVTRSGTQVKLEKADGTMVTLAATTTAQSLNFSDQQALLRIEGNDVYLGDSNVIQQVMPNYNRSDSRNLSSINPGLSGTLYYNSPDAFVAFDLALGTEIGIAPKSYGASVRNTDELILIENESQYDENDDIVIRDKFGLEKKRFPMGIWQWGSAKATPDGHYIAIARKPTNEWSSQYETPVTIFDNSGNITKRYFNADAYDISNSGELFLVKYGSLYSMGYAPFSDNGTRLASFPDNTVRNIQISPDRSKVVFSAEGTDDIRHIFVMNIDGSQLRQLTTSDSTTKSEGSPVWSPDGKHIAFVYGKSLLGCFSGLCYSECPQLLITPTQSSQIADITSSNMSPAFIPYQRTEQGKSGHTCVFSPPKWAASPGYPFKAGTTINGGGKNYGLKGSLLFSNTLDFNSINLWTGAAKREGASGDGIELANDKTHFYGSFDKRGLYHYEQVKRFDLLGNEEYLFDIPEDNYGPIAESPDGKYLAIGHYFPEDTLSIYLTDYRKSNGDGLALMTFEGEFGGWQWLDDGSLLYARSNTIFSHPKQFLFNESRKLLSFPTTIDHLALSPNGKQYAFKMGLHIWTVNTNGSGLKQLTVSDGHDNYPTWSNDGKVVLVTHRDDVNSPRIYAVPSDGERVYLGHNNLPSTARRLYSAEFGGIHAAARGRMIWKQ